MLGSSFKEHKTEFVLMFECFTEKIMILNFRKVNVSIVGASSTKVTTMTTRLIYLMSKVNEGTTSDMQFYADNSVIL